MNAQHADALGFLRGFASSAVGNEITALRHHEDNAGS